MWIYVNAQPLHADYMTSVDYDWSVSSDHSQLSKTIMYAAITRFDEHSYHVLERTNVNGARVICSDNAFSVIEFCSNISPGFVSSSTTVGFVSADVLEDASLTLTSHNVTASMTTASASQPITAPLTTWWLTVLVNFAT